LETRQARWISSSTKIFWGKLGIAARVLLYYQHYILASLEKFNTLLTD